jgi:hypothetical protein
MVFDADICQAELDSSQSVFSPTAMHVAKLRVSRLKALDSAAAAGSQFFNSNRRTADQGPETPPLFARTRHHIVSVGSVLVLN